MYLSEYVIGCNMFNNWTVLAYTYEKTIIITYLTVCFLINPDKKEG